MTILVVDEDPSVHDLLTYYLGDSRLFHAYADSQAVSVLSDQRVDGVLLDAHLIGATGFELLRHIRAATDSPPVVVFSSSYPEHYRELSLRGGAVDFVVKSSENYRGLAERLGRVLRGHNGRRTE